ncbi:nitrogen regulation protein NR(II) [Paenibacillus sp. sgz500958]|uniref:two-component system sensor histidine kinase NtrB n=1 Tax=Paenibacillus sp. sgz500958 TaxID=3242475 RepID=UPI0036D343DE
MISIITAIKDILLQVSAAWFFVVLFQWRLGLSYMTRRDGRFPDDQTVLILGCGLSVVLCSILSTTLFGGTYINLAILPAYIGILYGSYRSATAIAVLFFLCIAFFSPQPGASNLLLNSGLLIYPMLFGLNAPFKKATWMEKIGMLWMTLIPSMLLLEIFSFVEEGDSYCSTPSEMMTIAIYRFSAVILGATLIYYIETAWDKLHTKIQMDKISKEFQWEADKLQQITHVIPLSIVSLDENGIITGLNEQMVDLIGTHKPIYTKNDILGRPLSLFLYPKDEEFVQQLAESIRNKKRSVIRVSCQSKSYHVYTSPLLHRGSGLPAGMLLMVQDMTEEEKMRSELDNVERLTLVGQMAAGITHEIRNPMAVVRGFMQLMREKSPSSLDSYYQIVLEELDRANSIINDFLSLAQSRISQQEKVLLDHIIDDLGPLLWADANLRGQSVEIKLAPDLPELLLNVREIKQLILNMGRNGMEAMGPKGVLTIETRHIPNVVELIVRDTGVGISALQREKLFVPFFTTKNQGTGLGLSLCLSIVERHNGKIIVNSEEGKGTEFIISFPCIQEELLTHVIGE